MIILKFGGTSVNSAEKIKTICNVVAKEKSRSPVVVVSAVRGVTDLLLSLCNTSISEQKIILVKITVVHKELIESVFGSYPPPMLIEYLTDAIKKIEITLAKEKNAAIKKDAIVAFGELLSSHIIAAALEKEHIASLQDRATSCIVTNDHFGSAELLPIESKRKTKKILLPLIKKGIVPGCYRIYQGVQKMVKQQRLAEEVLIIQHLS